MDRTTRGVGYAIGDRPVVGGRDVRSTDPSVFGTEEAGGEVGEPMRVGACVVVEVGDDLPGGRLHAGVAGATQATVLRSDELEIVLAGDHRRRVGRAVVHDDHLVVRVFQVGQTLQAIPYGALPVVGADHHGDVGPGRILREWNLGEGFADALQGGLGAPIPAGEPKIPIFDVVTAPVPLVGPGKDEGAGAPGSERRPDLPVQGACLVLLAVRATVQSDLCHDHRLVASYVVEAGEVGFQVFLLLEIDVECDKVDEGQPQILCGGIVDVGDEASGILAFGSVVESLQVTLHAAGAVPPHNGRRDFAAYNVAEDGRVAC